MIVSGENARPLIPQSDPFVMIDDLLYVDENSCRSGFLVKASNIFVEDGFFTEPGMLENMAQTAAARAGYLAKQEGKPVMVGYIGAVKNFEVFHLPKTNELIETEINIENQVFNVTVISGIVRCRGMVMAACEMKIFINNTK